MAAHAVSCLLTEGSEELEENLRFIQITRQRGLWQPTNEAIKFARSHRPDLPATAEKLIEAFQ